MVTFAQLSLLVLSVLLCVGFFMMRLVILVSNARFKLSRGTFIGQT